MASPNGNPPTTARTFAVYGFAIVTVCAAGLAFVYKMTEFGMTIGHDEVQGFGATAIAIYLIGLVPVICFMFWAILSGKFRDIEAPKHRMFELDAEIERGGELGVGR